MDLVDQTPFSTLAFESLGPEGDPLQIVVLRGTFAIRSGEVLKPLPDQEPIVAADEYYGEPGQSSVEFPNDLAPYKPNADILINATAYAPGGEPSPFWEIAVEVGQFRRKWQVTGPRQWQRRLLVGWSLSESEPVATVPLRYERAFGGHWEHEGQSTPFEENPVGQGFVHKKHLPKRCEAPCILELGQKPPKPGATARPVGVGPLAPMTIFRRRHAGTYDEHWQKNRAPAVPTDFKYDFYNAAHPDLIYPGFLKGGENIVVHGMRPEGRLSFTLPSYRIGMVVTDKAGYSYGALANLDTLHLDLEAMKAYLVWRIGAPIFEDGVERIVLKMKETIDQGGNHG